MKKSIYVPLDLMEFDALYAQSRRDLRHPRDQARYIIRQALGLTEGDRHGNVGTAKATNQSPDVALIAQ